MMMGRILCLATAMLLCVISLGCGSNSSPSAVTGTGNALVANYTVSGWGSNQTMSAWVEFGTDTSYGRQTSVINSTAIPGGQTVSILVAGMKPETMYHMRAHVTVGGVTWVDQDKTFMTGSLPTVLPAPGIAVTQPTAGFSPAPGVELLSLVAPNNNMLQTVATDLQGNIIWYYENQCTPVKLMANGHMILNINTDLLEVDLAGNTIHDVSTAAVNQSLQAGGYSFTISGFSHDVLVLPNGHWVAIGKVAQNFTGLSGYPGVIDVSGDAIVDVDPLGNVAWGWSAFDYLDVNRALQGLPDWTHANALVYTADGNLLLSMRNQSWIIKIDYANGGGSGNVLWTLGEDGNLAIAGGDPGQWFYGQHDPNVVSSNGSVTTLNVFDDGNLRINSSGVACGTSSSAPACYSRAAQFQVDEGAYVATVLWQDLPGLYTFWGGSIGTLSNGDIEFDLSDPLNAASSQIMEVTPTDSPQVVWQMNITGENAYRGDRIPSLYPGVTWQQ